MPARGRLWIGLVAVLALAILTWAVNQGGFSGGGRNGDADPTVLSRVSLARRSSSRSAISVNHAFATSDTSDSCAAVRVSSRLK